MKIDQIQFNRTGKWTTFAAVAMLILAMGACSSNPETSGADKPLTKFTQEIKSETTSLTLKPSQQFYIPVTVKNTGTEVWAANGNYPVHLSYLWFDGTKQLPIDTTRTSLPNDLAPGQELAIKANLTAPPSPGVYTLRFTMVQERVAWFASVGAKTFDVPVTVE